MAVTPVFLINCSWPSFTRVAPGRYWPRQPVRNRTLFPNLRQAGVAPDRAFQLEETALHIDGRAARGRGVCRVMEPVQTLLFWRKLVKGAEGSHAGTHERQRLRHADAPLQSKGRSLLHGRPGGTRTQGRAHP